MVELADTYKTRRERILNLRAKNERLTGRQRAVMAISHEEPDRVPIDVWTTPEIQQKMIAYWGFTEWEECLQFLGVDFRYWRGSSYVGQRSVALEDGSVRDIWGVPRQVVTLGEGHRWTGSYREVTASPLACARTVRDIDDYEHWPSADWWDYSKIPSEIGTIRERSGDVFLWSGGDRFDRTAQLKPMMYLRGIEQAFIDLAAHPELVEAIVSHIHEYFMDYNRHTFQASAGLVDGFFCGDDMGTQQAPMMSARMYGRYFKRRFGEQIALAHGYDLPVMYHTCGSVRSLIPEFIDCGLDVLQSLQPHASNMDLCCLKHDFGSELAFQGGGDIQQVLPSGSPADVRKMVRRLAYCGARGGGYIFGTAHNIQADTPIDNVVALFEAYHEFGAY